jgi:stage II sporulation protein D
VLTPVGPGQLAIDGQPAKDPSLAVSAAAGEAVFVASVIKGEASLENEYPGTLRISVSAAGIAVINEVPVETYVGCVVANEVWPTFQTEAYRAQAVVSRTFVLYQMDRRPANAIDVTATQGSQVYRGFRRDDVGRRAREAAEYTSGIVLTYSAADGRQKLFCAYFSAACGGHSQSAAFLGPESDVPPLAGGVECDYCKIAPGETYRWGPLMLPVTDVTTRLAVRYPEVKKLGTIAAIEAIERADSGRTVSLRLSGSGGAVFELLAERFRLAVDPMRIRSTHFRVRVDREQMIFEDGRGFGHGLGLCQWGMEGQARESRTAGQILHYYYPGAQLTRAY